MRLKILFFLGFKNYLLKNITGNRILCFHGIDIEGNTSYNSRFISQQYFDELITYLSTHYNIISLDDFYLKKFRSDTLNIALTFDDGLKNNYELAVPILEKHQAPATFFVIPSDHNDTILWPDYLDLVSFHSTLKEIVFEGKAYVRNNKNNFVHKGISLKQLCQQLDSARCSSVLSLFQQDWKSIKQKALDNYWKLMSSDELIKISSNPLFKIEAHGSSHANLVTLSLSDATLEIKQCKQKLEEIIKQPIESFAFPFGKYSPELLDISKGLGFKKLLTVDYASSIDEKDNVLQCRFVINPHIKLLEQVYFIGKGTYM